MSGLIPDTVTLTVPGIGSDHCAGIVRKMLERLDGVGEIEKAYLSMAPEAVKQLGGISTAFP